MVVDNTRETPRRTTMPQVPVKRREAVDLAHAWVAELATARGVRALLIKGPTLHRQALRLPRASSDVDILVDPDGFETFCLALQAAGWTEREVPYLLQKAPNHSRTFIHQSWPCDIDVHSYYPGFNADPREVFALLWSQRSQVTFASRPCPCPDRSSNALILALHSLRSRDDAVRHETEMHQLLTASFTDAELHRMGELAAATASVEPLSRVLSKLGVQAPQSRVRIDQDALEAWRVRTDVGYEASGTYRWITALKSAPLHQKLKILWHAIWPPEHDLLLIRPDIPNKPLAFQTARLRRLAKGVVTLPQVLRSISASHRPSKSRGNEPTAPPS